MADDHESSSSSAFVRALAHSSSRQERQRALEAVKMYIKALKKTNSQDMRKLHLGLFYAYWHCDKTRAQNELSESICALLHDIPSASVADTFTEAFWATEARQWDSIDKLRLDKYMSLVRNFIRHSLAKLAARGWLQADVDAWSQTVSRTLTHGDEELKRNSRASIGLALHVADVVFPELANAAENGGGAPLHATVAVADALIQPLGMINVPASLVARVLAPEDGALDKLAQIAYDDAKRNSLTLVGADGALDAIAERLIQAGSRQGCEGVLRKALYAASKRMESAAKQYRNRRAKKLRDGDDDEDDEDGEEMEEEDATIAHEVAEPPRKKKRKRMRGLDGGGWDQPSLMALGIVDRSADAVERAHKHARSLAKMAAAAAAAETDPASASASAFTAAAPSPEVLEEEEQEEDYDVPVPPARSKRTKERRKKRDASTVSNSAKSPRTPRNDAPASASPTSSPMSGRAVQFALARNTRWEPAMRLRGFLNKAEQEATAPPGVKLHTPVHRNASPAKSALRTTPRSVPPKRRELAFSAFTGKHRRFTP